MKTIKQVAEELGVSKQAVYKRLSGKLKDVCAPYVHTEHSKTLLSEEAVDIIKSDFLQTPYETKTHTEHSKNTPERIQIAPDAFRSTPERSGAELERLGILEEKNAKLQSENQDLKHQVQCLLKEKELLEQAIADLKSDKSDLQRHRDNLTAALTVSKTDLARLENIIMRISSLPLGRRVFGWSGAIAQLTAQSETDISNVIEVKEKETETISE